MSVIEGATRNPFPGLRSFETADEYLFFGREQQIDDILRRLRRHRLVAVVGTSGSGKSSLIRAGVLPALYGGFMAGHGSHWRVAIMRPGGNPMTALAEALQHSGIPNYGELHPELSVGLIEATLERGSLGLVDVATEARLARGEQILVVVDQFEELFRYHGKETAGFVKLILNAAESQCAPVYVIVTMRSDFLGDCAAFRGFPEAINDGLFLVPRMTRDQLRAAITGPIGVAGAQITPRLVTQLLNDAGDDPDQLPLLQHVLMRTWDIWNRIGQSGEPIDLAHYEATGGIKDALSRHGDEVYESLQGTTLQEAAERLFKCLTERGSDNRGLRRPTRFDRACAVTCAQAEDLLSVADAFRSVECSFIVPPPDVTIRDRTVLDIVHESLMRAWKRLRRWVNEEARSAEIYRRLAAAAAAHSRGEAALLRNPELALALEWRESATPNEAWGERYASGFARTLQFLDDSAAEHARERQERTRRARAMNAILAASVVVLIALLCISIAGWSFARTETDKANAERVADMVAGWPAGSATGALAAAEAFGIADTPRTQAALLKQVSGLGALARAPAEPWASASIADRGRLAILAFNSVGGGHVVGLNAATLERLFRLDVPSNVQAVCGFRHDIAFAVATSGQILVYRYQGTVNKISETRLYKVPVALGCISSARTLAVAFDDGTLGLTVAESGAAVARVGFSQNPVHGLTVSDDDRYLAVMSGASGVDVPATVHLLSLPALREKARVNIYRTCADFQCSGLMSFTSNAKTLRMCDAHAFLSAAVPSLRFLSTAITKCPTAPQTAVFDREAASFLVFDDGQLSVQSVDGVTQPQVSHDGVQGAAYALSGDRIVKIGSEPATFDLNARTRRLSEKRYVISHFSDSGDGIHAIALSGGVPVLMDISGPVPAVLHSIRITRAHFPLGPADAIAYDPQRHVLTAASALGVIIASENGTVLKEVNWKNAGIDCANHVLSARGGYIACRSGLLLDDSVAIIGAFRSITSISEDEKYVFAEPSDTYEDLRYMRPTMQRAFPQIVHAYALPSLRDITRIPAASGPIAVTAAARAFAYVGADGSLRLAEFNSGRAIGDLGERPKAPRVYTGLRFTADERYLVATYRDGTGRTFQDAYSTSPLDWRRALCLMAGRELSGQESDELGMSFAQRKACNSFEQGMLSPVK